jgi:hypothetical protein
VAHELPFQLTVVPPAPTATQKVDELHDTESATGMVAGAVHTLPFQVT